MYIEPGAFGPPLIESVQGLSKSIIFVKKKCNYFCVDLIMAVSKTFVSYAFCLTIQLCFLSLLYTIQLCFLSFSLHYSYAFCLSVYIVYNTVILSVFQFTIQLCFR